MRKEICISDSTRALEDTLKPQTRDSKKKINKRLLGLVPRRAHKRFVRVGLLVMNLAVLGLVLSFVLGGSDTTTGIQQSAATEVSNDVALNPLDQLSSADIAVQVARVVGLPQERAVTNRADTVNAQLDVSPADTTVVAKPQIVETASKSLKDLQIYVTKPGDTISKLAAKFNITSDTIRWSNNLGNDDAIATGTRLYISPVPGIVYIVKPGDTAQSLAEKFSTSKAKIVNFNDAYNGLAAGRVIIIPEGVKTVAPAVFSPMVATGSFTANFGGGGYDYGYCTWWASARRAQIGKPIPSNLGNASSWKYLAQQAGFGVGNAPKAGAVIWTPPRDYYGHVGFVESVNSDGSVNISEMNTAGWNVVSRKTLSPSEAASYYYIY